QAETFDTPFALGGVSFERVSDDEERAMNGEMFKDARLQERIMDAVHAVEFDLEDVPSAPVGYPTGALGTSSRSNSTACTASMILSCKRASLNISPFIARSSSSLTRSNETPPRANGVSKVSACIGTM